MSTASTYPAQLNTRNSTVSNKLRFFSSTPQQTDPSPVTSYASLLHTAVTLCNMKLGLCLPSGVPTTPPPEKPAPNPRFNDLTRPRALQINTDPRQGRLQTSTGGSAAGGKPQLQRQQEQRWSEKSTERTPSSLGRSANDRGLPGSDPFFFEQHQLLHQRQSSSSDPDFPMPWQGNINLPASDEETMNSAQTWIAQILHENCEDGNDDEDVDSSSDVLLDGRVLCRVANAIASGTVEVIHQDKSNNVSNMFSFSVACRMFGVPAGALFDVEHIDPRRVGLCLHVLSRVVRDTVPGFAGPFITLPGGSSPTPTTEGDEDTSNFASLRQWPPPQDSAATPVSGDEEGEAKHQQAYQHHHRQPRPPTPPTRPPPLSFPSRFSPATQADDVVWDSLFPPPASSAVGGGGGGGGTVGNIGTDGEGGGHDAAGARHATGMEAVTPTPRYEFSESAAATTASGAAAAAQLSTWLSNLNLGTFEDSLVNIGVESMGDLRYVEEQDLSAIGMHGPQIRKLLQNRP